MTKTTPPDVGAYVSHAVRDPAWYVRAMEKLVGVTQALSHANSLSDVLEIVRFSARDLLGADGATFILREGDNCFYADENAISPLWKGQRFPMHTCVSGWVMNNRESVFIEDIYKDPRVPQDIYRPTFVKSMLMVPIRHNDPVGTIGNYWAHQRQISLDEMWVLQVLADTTALALENVKLRAKIETKV